MLELAASSETLAEIKKNYVNSLEAERESLLRTIIELRAIQNVLMDALARHEQLRNLAYDSGYYSACIEKTGEQRYKPLLRAAIAERNELSEQMNDALADMGIGGRDEPTARDS